MNNFTFKKLPIVCAVSAAILSPLTVNADEFEEQIAAVKLSTFQQQLLVNTVYQENAMTYVEAELLTKVDSLPVECDPQSVFPVSEQHVDNPADALVGNWKMETESFDDFSDDDLGDDDLGDDDLGDDDLGDDDFGDDDFGDDDFGDDDFGDDDFEDDDMDEDQDEQEDEMEGEETEPGDEVEDENSDQDNDEDSNDEDGNEESEDGEFDMDPEGDFEGFLTVTASGYLVSSEVETRDGVATCNVSFIGEVNGDTYTPVSTTAGN